MSNEPLDLNAALDGVSTALPRLQTGDYHVKVKNVEVKPNAAGTGNNLVVDLVTQDDAVSSEGEPMAAGAFLRKWFPLQASENQDIESVKRNVCSFIDACLGTDESARPSVNDAIPRLIGCDLIASVKFKDGDRGPQNDVGFLRPLEG